MTGCGESLTSESALVLTAHTWTISIVADQMFDGNQIALYFT